MTEAYRAFGSYILFKEKLHDELGHLYRAGEFDAGGIRRTAWLRIFDAPGIPAEEMLGSFDDARQIGKLLQAANVASGTDYFAEEGIPAVASDYIAGQPLSYLFKKVEDEGFPVAVDNALLIMEKISLGLASGLVLDIGGRPLVHGMLHPGLIIVSNDGEGVVSGFGVADHLLNLLDTAEAEKIKPYLAPEVIVTRTPSKRADVYSLGAILYQLLTGESLPANPEERAGILDRAEMSYDGEAIPDDIKALLARCVAEKMEDRYSSAADFKKELDKLLYGGNYSPTTFNLALFMDRLFRDEIEADEKAKAHEAEVDVEPYLKPEPEPEEVEELAAPSKGGGKGLYLMIAAALLVVALGLVFFMRGGLGGPPPTPTPTPEEIAAQKAAQEKRIMELAAQIADQKMKEMETNISSELEQRQKKIEELQKQLTKKQSGPSNAAAEARRKAEIQKQIEAEKEQQRQQQEKLKKEKERLLEQSRREAEARAKKEADEAAAKAAEEAKAEEASTTPEETTPVTAAASTTEQQETGAPAVPMITENQFVPATEVDSQPALLKEEPVKWPRASRKVRHKKGMIIVEATVNASGRVEAVRILRADEEGGGIPDAVMTAVKKYLFKPGMKNGVKVKTTATVVKRYSFR